MKTILIYSLIPEDQIFFIIPDEELLPEWNEMLAQSNGKIVNIHELNDGMRNLMAATSSKEEYCDKEVDKKYHCCLAKFKFELASDSPEITGPFSRVFVSGFWL
jgi:regulator of PEP synthase PpsR (kinase-PPPase family)